MAKYADASRVEIRLTSTDGELRFEVEDDGRGFDRAVTRYGTGLQGMADRLDAIGGSIEVDSAPGRGDEGGRTPPGRRRSDDDAAVAVGRVGPDDRPER